MITADPARAAATLDRIRGKLMLIDEFGMVYADYDELEASIEPYSAEGHLDLPYTPNFVSDVNWCQYGAEVTLDTKGVMSEAMARGMADASRNRCVRTAFAGHVTGWHPEISGLMREWNREARRD